MQFCRRESISTLVEKMYFDTTCPWLGPWCVRVRVHVCMLEPYVTALLGRDWMEMHMCMCAKYTYVSQVCVFRSLHI